MICRIDELFKKDVINVENGSRIGYVGDLEIDMDSGRINAVLVVRPEKGLSFKKPDLMRIDWNSVAVTGSEAILVRNADICAEEKKENKHIFDIFNK